MRQLLLHLIGPGAVGGGLYAATFFLDQPIAIVLIGLASGAVSMLAALWIYQRTAKPINANDSDQVFAASVFFLLLGLCGAALLTYLLVVEWRVYPEHLSAPIISVLPLYAAAGGIALMTAMVIMGACMMVAIRHAQPFKPPSAGNP